jgi:hypothetical protein
MAGEKDQFGETLKLAERAKEDIYFAERDRDLLEKLRAQLQKIDKRAGRLNCPKCARRPRDVHLPRFYSR